MGLLGTIGADAVGKILGIVAFCMLAVIRFR
jgi:hypothetical protein